MKTPRAILLSAAIAAASASAALANDTVFVDADVVRKAQQSLTKRGIPTAVDGQMGPQTRAALSTMAVLFAYALVQRDLVAIDVMRERGELFRIADGDVRNDYVLRLLNKTESMHALRLSVVSASGPVPVLVAPERLDIEPGEVLNVPVSLVLPSPSIAAPIVDVVFTVCTEADHCNSERSRFFGPSKGGTSR